MRILQIGIIAQLSLCVLCSGATALQTGEKAPAFKLDDQFGKPWNLTDLKGQVVVLIAADRDSGPMMDPWISAIKNEYGDKVKTLGLLDLHSIPWIGRGIAKSRIKKETKEPLMLDFEGATGKSYGVSSKHPVVVVIDRSGVIQNVSAAKYGADVWKATSGAIDNALK